MSETGSDPACWLELICAECGAVLTEGQPTGQVPPTCWRCGAATATDD